MKRLVKNIKDGVGKKSNTIFLSLLIWLLDKYLKDNRVVSGWDSVDDVGYKATMNSLKHLKYKREAIRRNK